VFKYFYSILRFVARHVAGFWGAIVALLTAGFIAGLVAALLFALFAAAVHQGWTQGADVTLLRQLSVIRTPWLDEAMLEVTALGGGSVLIMMAIVAALFLWMTEHKWSVYLLIISVIGGQLLNVLLKEIFQRPRPTAVQWGEPVNSLSFPSGHAMISVITYGCIAYLVGRLSPTRRLRWSVWIVAALLVGAICFSRMYLGVHYPSDVLAGICGGVAWLAFVASGLASLEYFANRRPQTKREEHDLHVSSAHGRAPPAQ
jgi:undecaprenyl-diphosphatase